MERVGEEKATREILTPETNARREDYIASIVCREYAIDTIRCIDTYSLADFALSRDGKMLGYLEVRLTNRWTTYLPFCHMDGPKWERLNRLSESSGYPVAVAMGYRDALYMLRLSDVCECETAVYGGIQSYQQTYREKYYFRVPFEKLKKIDDPWYRDPFDDDFA